MFYNKATDLKSKGGSRAEGRAAIPERSVRQQGFAGVRRRGFDKAAGAAEWGGSTRRLLMDKNYEPNQTDSSDRARPNGLRLGSLTTKVGREGEIVWFRRRPLRDSAA